MQWMQSESLFGYNLAPFALDAARSAVQCWFPTLKETRRHEQEEIVDVARHSFCRYKPRKSCVGPVELVSN
jgi:hypothetical protein